MEYYYITYFDGGIQSGNYPHDIKLGCLDDYDIAEKFMVDEFSELHQSKLIEMHSQDDIYFETKDEYSQLPRLITNDASFYLLYKRVFTYSEFKLFCRIYDNYEALSPEEKQKVRQGTGTIEAFEYFERLIKGEGKFAYEYRSNETWHDESGNVREMEVDSGWKLNDKYWVNEKIKEKYGW